MTPSRILLALTLMAHAGCHGKTRSDDQAQGQIPFPQNPAVSNPGDRFGLAGTDGQDSFEGSTVLYDAEPSVEALRKLLVTSRDFRTARGDYYQFLKVTKPAAQQSLSALQKQVVDREKQLADTKREEQVQAYFGDKATIHYQERLTAAQTYANQILGHHATSGEADLLPVMAAYCDAKILELAVSATLYHQIFLKRPTPHILCESYYSTRYPDWHEQPYFQGETCQDSYIAKNGAATCIWEQGVYQTTWFKTAPKACGDAVTASACFTSRYRTAAFDIFQAFARIDLPLNVRKALLRGATAPAISLPGFEMPAVNFQFINLAKMPPSHKKAPLIVISQLQRKLGTNEGGPFPDDALAWQKALIALGERLETDGGAAGGDYTSSESDFHFFVTQNQLLREVKHDEFYEAAALGTSLQELSALLMPQNHERSEALKQDLITVQNQVLKDTATLESTERAQDATLDQKIQAAIRAANEPGLARAFWNTFRVSIDRLGTVIRVQLKLREPEKAEIVSIMQGCVDAISDRSIACGSVFTSQPPSGETWLDALTLTHHPETGMLKLTYDMPDAAALGWKVIPRVSGPDKSFFQEIHLESLNGTQWEWKIFPGRLETQMAILTGDITVSQNGSKLIEGGFSWYQRTAD